MGRASGRSRARPHRPHHPPRQDDRSRGPRDGRTRGRDRRGDRGTEGAEPRHSARRRSARCWRAVTRGTNIERLSSTLRLSPVLRSGRERPVRRSRSVIDELEASEALTPSLFFFEVRNALVINERAARRITGMDRPISCAVLTRLPIRLAPCPRDDVLMALARARKLTVYDAAYLELAKRERLPLATLDRALEKAAIAEGVALFGA